MAVRRKIPISIKPFFWIFAVLIGFLMSGTLLGTIIWVVIIFVSVLVHELGHATVALAFNQNPKIELMILNSYL